MRGLAGNKAWRRKCKEQVMKINPFPPPTKEISSWIFKEIPSEGLLTAEEPVHGARSNHRAAGLWDLFRSLGVPTWCSQWKPLDFKASVSTQYERMSSALMGKVQPAWVPHICGLLKLPLQKGPEALFSRISGPSQTRFGDIPSLPHPPFLTLPVSKPWSLPELHHRQVCA